jgi:hypothetical protein
MPGISELDQLANSYGLAIALLLIAVLGLVVTVRHLFRANQFLYGRIEALLTEQAKTLNELLSEAMHGGGRNRS